MIGSEVTSAFWKSSSKACESALSALPSPNCSIRKSACCFASEETASSEGSTLLVRVVARELEGDERGAPVLGELAGVVRAVGAAHVLDVLASARGARPRRSRRTGTPGRPSGRRCGSGRGRSPTPSRGSAPGPRRPPGRTRRCRSRPARASSSRPSRRSHTAMITNASQPRIAFFRCCALQRPARAARFFVGSMKTRMAATGRHSRSVFRCRGGSVIRTPAAPPAPGSPSAASRASSAGTSSSRPGASSSRAAGRRG